jgi:hypothetical protein
MNDNQIGEYEDSRKEEARKIPYYVHYPSGKQRERRHNQDTRTFLQEKVGSR